MTSRVQTTKLRRLAEDTVLLDITFHCPCNTRSTEIKAETQANKKWLSHRKALFKSELYDNCHRIQTQTAQWLAKRSIPCQLKGYYRFSTAAVPEVLEYLAERDRLLAEAADKFCDEWRKLLDIAKEELKDLYDPSRYPSVRYMRAGISNEYRLIDISPPTAAKVGKEISTEEGKKAQRMWEEEINEVRFALRAEMLKLVTHLSEKLKPSPTSKRVILTEAAIENTLEWLELFNKRNVLEDDELDKLVQRAKEVLNGVDVVALRKDDKAKQAMAREMDKAIEALNTMTTKKPSRRITFDD